MAIGRVRGIIFDMDNTLLRSRIDFAAIKNALIDYFMTVGLFPSGLDISEHTASTLIELTRERLTDEQVAEMWSIVRRLEVVGMKDADLEPGVMELLSMLKGKYTLVVVTNNAIDAAETALKANGIYDEFDLVVGREQFKVMKPSPAGFLYVRDRFPDILPEEWVSVGDAWIDGKASTDAGIRFVAYQGDMGWMNSRGVFPSANIQELKVLVEYL